jgi:hypothetical protein
LYGLVESFFLLLRPRAIFQVLELLTRPDQIIEIKAAAWGK